MHRRQRKAAQAAHTQPCPEPSGTLPAAAPLAPSTAGGQAATTRLAALSIGTPVGGQERGRDNCFGARSAASSAAISLCASASCAAVLARGETAAGGLSDSEVGDGTERRLAATSMLRAGGAGAGAGEKIGCRCAGCALHAAASAPGAHVEAVGREVGGEAANARPKEVAVVWGDASAL